MILHTRLVRIFGAQGITLAPWLILIDPDQGENTPLIVHEMTHVEQMKRTGPWAFRWRYLTNIEFRREMEKEAYGLQILSVPEMNRDVYFEKIVRHVSSLWYLDLSPLEARKLLS